MTPPEGKASDVLERMRRTATKQPAEANGRGEHVKANPPLKRLGRAAGREKVRYTLDLTGDQHHFLKRFAVDAGVDASQVMRALLTLLDKDHDLAKQVMQQLLSGAMQ
jgi:hypothetical protein